jgi:hypothetical protein
MPINTRPSSANPAATKTFSSEIEPLCMAAKRTSTFHNIGSAKQAGIAALKRAVHRSGLV